MLVFGHNVEVAKLDKRHQGVGQMDPLTISSLAAAAVSILGKFLSNATEGAATKAGETVFEAVKSGFLPDKSKAEVLEDFAREPGDEDLAAALRVQLKKLLQADEQLATQLQLLLRGQDAGSTVNITQTAGSHSTQYGVVHGDVRSEVHGGGKTGE
jgi:hypothetical protein